MATTLRIDTPGGANFGGNHLRNVASLHVGGSALADTTLGALQVTGSLYASTGSRTPNNVSDAGRNAGNTAWIDKWKINASNELETATATKFGSIVTITGATTLSSTLAVTGRATFNGTSTDAGASINATGATNQYYLDLTSGATILGRLYRPTSTNDIRLDTPFGGFVLGGTLAVAGAVTGGTYNGQTIGAATTLTGTLGVNGILSLQAAETVMGGAVGVGHELHQGTSDAYFRISGGGAAGNGAMAIFHGSTHATTPNEAHHYASTHLWGDTGGTARMSLRSNVLIVGSGTAAGGAGAGGIKVTGASQFDSTVAVAGIATFSSPRATAMPGSYNAESADAAFSGYQAGNVYFGAVSNGLNNRGIIFRTLAAGTAFDAARITHDGILAIGTTVVTGAAAGDVVIGNGKSIRGVNAAGDSTFKLLTIDSGNVVRAVGTSGTVNVADVYFGIPHFATGSYPAASAANNGVIWIDATNNRICFHANGARYYANGTSF